MGVGLFVCVMNNCDHGDNSCILITCCCVMQKIKQNYFAFSEINHKFAQNLWIVTQFQDGFAHHSLKEWFCFKRHKN